MDDLSHAGDAMGYVCYRLAAIRQWGSGQDESDAWHVRRTSLVLRPGLAPKAPRLPRGECSGSVECSPTRVSRLLRGAAFLYLSICAHCIGPTVCHI